MAWGKDKMRGWEDLGPFQLCFQDWRVRGKASEVLILGRKISVKTKLFSVLGGKARLLGVPILSSRRQTKDFLKPQHTQHAQI